MFSGSAMGLVKPKERLIRGNIRHGDAIILCESSGIHANGLTLGREIGDRKDSIWRKIGHLFAPDKFPLRALPQGYLTPMRDGRPYGEALLDPTHIYVGLIEKCLDRGIDIHYAVNITGHGWRKLMRAKESFVYVIERLPKCPPIFDFIQEHAPVDDREAYGNFNMGAGFALYVAERDVDRVLGMGLWTESAQPTNTYRTFHAGRIEKSSAKEVFIKPKNLRYGGNTLGVR